MPPINQIIGEEERRRGTLEFGAIDPATGRRFERFTPKPPTEEAPPVITPERPEPTPTPTPPREEERFPRLRDRISPEEFLAEKPKTREEIEREQLERARGAVSLVEEKFRKEKEAREELGETQEKRRRAISRFTSGKGATLAGVTQARLETATKEDLAEIERRRVAEISLIESNARNRADQLLRQEKQDFVTGAQTALAFQKQFEADAKEEMKQLSTGGVDFDLWKREAPDFYEDMKKLTGFSDFGMEAFWNNNLPDEEKPRVYENVINENGNAVIIYTKINKDGTSTQEKYNLGIPYEQVAEGKITKDGEGNAIMVFPNGTWKSIGESKIDILSVSEAKTLGVPFGTTRAEAIKMGITPAEEKEELELQDTTAEEEEFMTRVLRLLPVKLKDSPIEVKNRKIEALRDFRAGKSLQQTVDEIKGFVITNEKEKDLAEGLRILAAGSGLELSEISAPINLGNPIKAMSVVENANLNKDVLGGELTDTTEAKTLIQKSNKVLDLLEKAPTENLGAFDGRKFKVKKFAGLSDEEIVATQRLQTAMVSLLNEIRRKSLGTAVTESEVQFLEPLLTDLLDQPEIIKAKMGELKEGALIEHNGARSTVNFPELTEEQLLDNKLRLNVYRNLGGGEEEKVGEGEIRVRLKSTGEEGFIPADEFNPTIYDKI